MNGKLRWSCGLVLAGIVSVMLGADAASTAVPPQGDRAKPLRGRAVVSGHGGIWGEVHLRQRRCEGCGNPWLGEISASLRGFPEPTVDVVVDLYGPLDLLREGPHGIHIHERGICEGPSYATAGGHFDPGPFGSSGPVDANHPFHMGDLPNLIVNDGGVGHLTHTTSRITLSPGPLSVFDADGSSVIVKMNPDRGIPGVAGASGGPRIACGVIEPVE